MIQCDLTIYHAIWHHRGSHIFDIQTTDAAVNVFPEVIVNATSKMSSYKRESALYKNATFGEIFNRSFVQN